MVYIIYIWPIIFGLDENLNAFELAGNLLKYSLCHELDHKFYIKAFRLHFSQLVQTSLSLLNYYSSVYTQNLIIYSTLNMHRLQYMYCTSWVVVFQVPTVLMHIYLYIHDLSVI